MRSDNPLYAQRREELLRTHFTEAMVVPAGHKTLHPDEALHHPDFYHNGRVWPNDNREIAKVLQGSGYHGLAMDTYKRIARGVDETGMYAENFRGIPEGIDPGNRIVYIVTPDGQKCRRIQVPQPGQTWTLGAYMQSQRMIELGNEGRIPQRAIVSSKRHLEDELLERVS